MEERRLASIQNTLGDNTHEKSSISASSIVRVSAYTADLRKISWLHAFSSHGDQMSRFTDTDETAQLPCVCQERARDSEHREFSHFNGVVCP